MAVKAYAPVALLCVFWLGGALAIAADGEVEAVRRQAARWRTERRIVDLHQHVGYIRPNSSGAMSRSWTPSALVLSSTWTGAP